MGERPSLVAVKTEAKSRDMFEAAVLGRLRLGFRARRQPRPVPCTEESRVADQTDRWCEGYEVHTDEGVARRPDGS